jgi:hypothetical protein
MPSVPHTKPTAAMPAVGGPPTVGPCAARASSTAPGPPAAITAATGNTSAVSAITRPCSVSVTLTAQKPPSKVYSSTTAAPMMIAVRISSSNALAKAWPAAWNCAAM